MPPVTGNLGTSPCEAIPFSTLINSGRNCRKGRQPNSGDLSAAVLWSGAAKDSENGLGQQLKVNTKVQRNSGVLEGVFRKNTFPQDVRQDCRKKEKDFLYRAAKMVSSTPSTRRSLDSHFEMKD